MRQTTTEVNAARTALGAAGVWMDAAARWLIVPIITRPRVWPRLLSTTLFCREAGVLYGRSMSGKSIYIYIYIYIYICADLPRKRQKQTKNHPTCRKIPQIIYIYLYFCRIRTGELRTRPRRAETRAGKPRPKKTHARTGAKHLLQGRRPEHAKTCLWRPQKLVGH